MEAIARYRNVAYLAGFMLCLLTKARPKVELNYIWNVIQPLACTCVCN